MENFDVVSFGSAVIDVFVNTEAVERGDFMCYIIGSKILIKDLKFDIGGGGTNTAVAFSRLGLKAGYIGKIGKDLEGIKILNMLKKEKVSFLGKIDKGQTGYSIILDSANKDRTILAFKGVNNEFLLSDIAKFRTKWLYFSSLLEKSLETQKKLAKIYAGKGVKLAFNPSSYLIKNERLDEILKFTSILILNKEEAIALSKESSQDRIIKKLHALGPKIIVITNKDKEVICSDFLKLYKIMPHKNIKVVERTGAGDAFASGFVAGQITGKSIDESLKLALSESEAVVQHFGAKNNLIRMRLKK